MTRARTRVTSQEIAEEWGISVQGVEKFLSRPGSPSRGKDGKWSLASATEFRLERMEAQRPGKPPQPGTIDEKRVVKLGLEIDRLRLRLDQERGRLITVEEVRATLVEYAGQVNACFDQFVSAVATTTHDPALSAKAEALTDRMRQTLADAILASST